MQAFKKTLVIFSIILLLMPFVSAISFYDDLNMRTKNIYNATNITATLFLGNGSLLTGVSTSVSTINRTQVVNNFAACTAGSAQVSENETARYCDASIVNTTEFDSLYANKLLTTSYSISNSSAVFLNLISTSTRIIGINLIRGNTTDSYGDYELHNSGGTLMLNYSASGTSANKLSLNSAGTMNLSLTSFNIGAGNIVVETGYVRIVTSAIPACGATTIGAIVFNSTTKKHQGCNSTHWNDLY